MTTIERYAIKPITIGSVGYILSRTVFPSLVDTKWNKTLTFSDSSLLRTLSGTRSISVPAMAGLAVAAGSVLAEITHDFVFPHIHWVEKSSEKASLAVASGISGAGMAGSIYLANPLAIKDLGLPTILLAGVATELLGDTIYTKFVKGTWEGATRD